MNVTQKGAIVGSVLSPGSGSAIGAAAGYLFGGHHSTPHPDDPSANDWQTGNGIAWISKKIKEGSFQWGNPSDKAATVIKDYNSIFGRDPTPTEINIALPWAQQGQGGAFIAQLKQQQDNTPEAINARNQAQWTADAPKNFDQVNGLFNQNLGRDATDIEKQHFGSLLASGQVDPYSLQSFMQQLPEYAQKQDANFRDSLKGDLQNSNAQYFQNKILPGIQSQFAQSGRAVDLRSTGLTNSLAMAAQSQNKDMDSYLANLSAQMYGGNKAAARGDYENQLAQNYAQRNYAQNRDAQLMDQTTNRQYDIENYGIQQRMYNSYLQQFGKRGNIAMGALNGGMSGASAGSAAGPWGALIGGVAGAGLGAYGQSQY